MSTFLIFAIPIAIGLILLTAYLMGVQTGWVGIAIASIGGIIFTILAFSTDANQTPSVFFAIIAFGTALYRGRRLAKSS